MGQRKHEELVISDFNHTCRIWQCDWNGKYTSQPRPRCEARERHVGRAAQAIIQGSWLWYRCRDCVSAKLPSLGVGFAGTNLSASFLEATTSFTNDSECFSRARISAQLDSCPALFLSVAVLAILNSSALSKTGNSYPLSMPAIHQSWRTCLEMI